MHLYNTLPRRMLRTSVLSSPRFTLLTTNTSGREELGGLLGRPLRPLCVMLQSADIVKSVLRNKSSLAGPLIIADDMTPMQRSNLKRLRQQLGELHSNGDADKTIRYVNGVPKIVPSSSASR